MTCARRHLVDAHFARRTDAAAEQAMREELKRCAECAAWYERHQLFEKLAGSSGARDRLMRPYGLSGAPGRRWLTIGVPAFATSLALLLAVVVFRGRSSDDDGFTPRGAATTGVALDVFRLAPNAAPLRASSSVKANEALAFSYQNGAGKKWLMVFAVDQGGRVYWYHPAWQQPSETPAAVPIELGASWHELPDAVTQPLPAGRLELRALFLDERLDVRQIEAAIDRPVQGALEVRRTLEVQP